MSTEHLGEWQERPYGLMAKGVVEAEDRTVDVTVRQPYPEFENSGLTVISANGWTLDENSMRLGSMVGTEEFGHETITFSYTNRSGRHGALQENVQDYLAVVRAQPEGARIIAVGESMGGAVVTMAMAELAKEQAAQKSAKARARVPKIEIAHLVAPGKYIDDEYMTTQQIVRCLTDEIREMPNAFRHYQFARYLGITAAKNILRRPSAVGAEFKELINGTVHDELRYVKSQTGAPKVLFWYAKGDKLLPAYAQEASTRDVPFDERIEFDGEHMQYCYDPKIARAVFTKNAAVLRQQSGRKNRAAKPSAEKASTEAVTT